MSKKNNEMKKQQKRGKVRRSNANGVGWSQKVSRSMTLSHPLVGPDELDVPLKFVKRGVLTSNATPLVSATFNPNCAYDVDPTVGSTETLGFDEYAALYSYYRVIGYKYKITFAANTNYPTMVYVTNTNMAVPGTNFSLYTTNPYCKSTLASLYGAKPTVFGGKIMMSHLTGSNACETADTYRALTTGVPSDKVFLDIAAEQLQGSTLEPGVGYDLQITMFIRFYSREVDLTLARMETRIKEIRQARALRDLQKKAAVPLPSEKKA